MYYLDNDEKRPDEKQQAKERKLNRRIEQQMVAEMACLLGHGPEDGLQWTASATDLMEALHILYQSGTVRDTLCRPYPFAHLVRRACCVLHVKCPSQPRRLANKALLRKGVRNTSFMDRYRLMKEELGILNPVSAMVRVRRKI